MSTNLIEFQDSEINIYSIYDILKSSWKFIFKVTLVFLILGIVVSFYYPSKFRSSVLISELTPEQSFYFKNNNELSNSIGIFYNTWYSSALRKFKENNILLNKAVIAKEKAPHINPKRIIKVYEIHSIDGENNTNSSSAEIKFSGNYEDYEVLKEILITTLYEINNEIKNEINFNMKSHIEMATRLAQSESFEASLEIKQQYDELLAKSQQERTVLTEKLAVEILFLEEQAKIARNLNIKEAKTDENYEIRNTRNASNYLLSDNKDELDFNDNYYNKGYLAIEEEVKALSKRLDNEKFFTNYETKVKLGVLKSTLETNTVFEIAESKIKKQEEFYIFSPLNVNDDFRVYNYFVEGSSVSKENSDFLLIITFIFIGLLSGSLIAVLESNYSKYKSALIE